MHRIIALLILWVLSLAAAAEPDYPKVRAELARGIPELAGAVIKPSAVPGILTIEFGDEVGYVTADGKYLFLGDLVEVATRTNLTNLAATERGKQIVRLIDEIGEDNMIVIGPKDAKRTMTVFTDVDCPYCARLHQDVPALNRAGVKVRYLLFPRGGIGSETYRKSVAVWCADNRVKAVGVAKAGARVEMKTCPNPVERHFQLGGRVGVTGTPTIFLDSGQRIGGYVPADRMLALIGVKPEAAAGAR